MGLSFLHTIKFRISGGGKKGNNLPVIQTLTLIAVVAIFIFLNRNSIAKTAPKVSRVLMTHRPEWTKRFFGGSLGPKSLESQAAELDDVCHEQLAAEVNEDLKAQIAALPSRDPVTELRLLWETLAKHEANGGYIIVGADSSDMQTETDELHKGDNFAGWQKYIMEPLSPRIRPMLSWQQIYPNLTIVGAALAAGDAKISGMEDMWCSVPWAEGTKINDKASSAVVPELCSFNRDITVQRRGDATEGFIYRLPLRALMLERVLEAHDVTGSAFLALIINDDYQLGVLRGKALVDGSLNFCPIVYAWSEKRISEEITTATKEVLAQRGYSFHTVGPTIFATRLPALLPS